MSRKKKATGYKIRIRGLMQIKKESNKKILVKPLLLKMGTVMKNSLLFIIATLNPANIGFLIQHRGWSVTSTISV